MSKSIVASKNLKKNHIIRLSDITFKSPGGGLKPYDYKKLINRRIKKDIQKDEMFSYKMIY